MSDRTIAYYDAEAAAFVERREEKYADQLEAFIRKVGRGADVLELGCGGGHDAEIMLAAGVNVFATDGSAELAARAEKRLGRPVRVMRFDELDAREAFDGVWANRSLLHVQIEELPGLLERIWRAMRPGAHFFASYKAGDGGGLDSLGRYYNFPSRALMESIYAAAAPWAELSIEERDGADHDNVARQWLLCNAVKGM
jgi:SAM-dependent methyltransferase